jgi:aspartyl/asparaginyl beta-hydroxylase (cupin superfamily)
MQNNGDLSSIPLQARGRVADILWDKVISAGYQADQLVRVKGLLDIWAHRQMAHPKPMQIPKGDLFMPDLQHDTPWIDPNLLVIANHIENAFQELKDEVQALQKNKRFSFYGVGHGSPKQSYLPDGWKEFSLLGPGNQWNKTNCELAPAAFRIGKLALLEHQFVAQVSYLALEPGAELPSHTDPANFLVSCHMGLIVPENCALKVAGEERPWIEGKCIAFNNSYLHSAYNRSDTNRIIFIVHALHPDLSKHEKQVMKFLTEMTTSTKF